LLSMTLQPEPAGDGPFWTAAHGGALQVHSIKRRVESAHGFSA